MMNKGEYLLVCLAEECSEIQKAVMKALRFGLDKGNPYNEQFTTNASEISKECCDLIAVVELLEEDGILKNTGTIQEIECKKNKVRQFMEISKEYKTLSRS